jgi:uncharacterized protein DUF2513
MKRDMELIRKILLAVEASPSGWAPSEVHELQMEGYSEEEVGYHALLVIEAGFAKGEDMTGAGLSPRGFLYRLTWQGHEFLDAARDDTRWNKAWTIVREKAGSVTVDVLKQVLTGLMKDALGLHS